MIIIIYHNNITTFFICIIIMNIYCDIMINRYYLDVLTLDPAGAKATADATKHRAITCLNIFLYYIIITKEMVLVLMISFDLKH